MRRSAKVLQVLIALGVATLLTGCGKNDLAPFTKVIQYPLFNGQEVVDAWVRAPGPKCSLQGDATQNIVFIEHPRGRWALPDSVVGLQRDTKQEDHKLVSGRCPVAVYHLLDETGKVEIGYYKRRFARPLTPPM